MMFSFVIVILLILQSNVKATTFKKPPGNSVKYEIDRQLTIKHIRTALTSPTISLLATDDIYIRPDACHAIICASIAALPVPITDDSDFTGVKRRFMEVIYTKTRFPNTYRDTVELVVVAKDVRTYVTWYCSVEPVDYSSLTILVNLIICGSVFACWVGVSSVVGFKSKKSRQ